METEIETIDAFNIPKRELTDEEATREVTMERISEFHIAAGEDLVDQVGHLVEVKTFGGWLMHKYSDKWEEIVDLMNSGGGVQRLMEFYEDFEDGDEGFYKDLCEFLNHTKATRKRINQILIQVTERHSR